jgi:hypothetical protein
MDKAYLIGGRMYFTQWLTDWNGEIYKIGGSAGGGACVFDQEFSGLSDNRPK